MGIILMDGFEKNSLDKWGINNGGTAYSSAGLDMSGNYVLEGTAADDCAYVMLASSVSEIYCSFRYRNTSVQSSTQHSTLMTFKDSSGARTLILDVNSVSREIEARRGNYNGTLLGSGGYLPLNTTGHFRVYFKPLNSGGQIIVYLDNVEIINYSGDTTNATENIKYMGPGCDSQGVGRFYFDDFIISTTDITKNLRIAGKAVTGAGTTTQWDPSAGANYQCVDEVPPVHTDYNSTNVTDEIDTFAIADCTEEIDNIEAVQVEISCAYEGSPTPTHLQAVLRCGSTNYPSGVDASPPSSFGAPITQIWAVNPDDSAAFEEADINAMEIGYKATA